ncbi:MAG: hypothetical protein Q7R33_02015 [Nitrosarchaeum sp.]|nr:hypothetical protein [Nitrosarchaeum sp.]
MFYRISNAVKKILIKELQALFIDHPIFGDNQLVITNKYQFDERPKYAIVVKTASADSVKLDLGNFKGIVISYTVLANLKNQSGRMIEWVREDVANIDNLVKPGFYVVEMPTDSTFTVEPYLTVVDEVLTIEAIGFGQATLQHQNINVGSEYVIAETTQKLVRDQHYSIDYVTGIITFLQAVEDFGEITVDYQYLGTKTGPFDVTVDTSNNQAIPGVTLAFGKFLKAGSLQVVVVYPSRQEVAKSFAGKWKMNVTLSTVAQDTDTQEQLIDLAAMYIWTVLQEKLVDDGIYIDNITMSGESEEEEVKTSNELSFLADLSFSVEVEWEVLQPILGVVKKIFLNRTEDFGQYDDAELSIRDSRGVNSSQRGVDYKLGLQPVENFLPYAVRPVQNYTLISSQTQT